MTKTSTELTTMQKEMALKLAEMQETTTTSENTALKLHANTIEVPNIGEAPAPLEVVVVDFITRREFFDKPYDADNPQPPACFAHGTGNSANFVPVANSPAPESKACKGCPNNEWGTAMTGKGKACGEVRYVAVMLPEACEPDDPIYTVRVTASQLKAFDGFVKQIYTRTRLLPLMFIADLIPVQAGSAFTATFKVKEENPKAEKCWGRIKDAQELLMQEPDFSNYEAPKPTRRRK